MVWGGKPWTPVVSNSVNESLSAHFGMKTSPGLVQNWPEPRVKEFCNPLAIAAERVRIAPGSTNKGLTLPISA